MNDVIYRTLARMIERGNLDGMSDKIDVFYAAGKIDAEQYNLLTEKYQKKQEELISPINEAKKLAEYAELNKGFSGGMCVSCMPNVVDKEMDEQ